MELHCKLSLWNFSEDNKEVNELLPKMIILRRDFHLDVHISRFFHFYCLIQYVAKYSQLQEGSFNSAIHSRE